MDEIAPPAIRWLKARSGTTLTFTELGMGTAPLGNLYRAIDEETAQATLRAAWEEGSRFYDTAPLYGLGLSETRLNHFLRGRARDSYLLSTKVGRLLRACRPSERTGIGKFFDTPSRQEVYDYSYDGVMRCVEHSLERLGTDRIDILFCHDLDLFNHRTQDAVDRHFRAFMDGGYRALHEMRAQGTVAAIGAGLNEWQMCERLARAGDFDIFLLAGRYTLLEQEPLDSFLPLCAERGIGIALGGPYNSGVLATGAKRGAFYNYEPAPPAILKRVKRIERVCAAHGVRLVEAALRFPLAHPAVLSVIPGAQNAHEVHRNAAILRAPIPAALWADLKVEGLLRSDAPVPS
jgi:D-threo-aldose 1-dehydrogenase